MLNTYKKAFSLTLLLVACAKNVRADIFTEMVEEMDRMHKRSQKLFKQMTQEFTNQYLAVEVKENSDKDIASVVIKNFDIKDKTLNAAWDENKHEWIIKTSAGTIVLLGSGKLLKIKTKTYHETHHEEEKGAAKFFHGFSGRNSMTLSFSSDIRLCEAQFEYDEKNKELAVQLPLAKKNLVTVPVVFKQTPSELNEK